MKTTITILVVLLLFGSCTQKEKVGSINHVNWEIRDASNLLTDSFTMGRTYLPVYSQIYQSDTKRTYNLTVTVSIRNISPADTVFLFHANYFNTEGHQIRSYFKHPVYVKPFETIEIVIDETDGEGGTGANFVFDWATKPNCNEPLFEAIMISTGQQGVSFLTKGINISRN